MNEKLKTNWWEKVMVFNRRIQSDNLRYGLFLTQDRSLVLSEKRKAK